MPTGTTFVLELLRFSPRTAEYHHLGYLQTPKFATKRDAGVWYDYQCPHLPPLGHSRDHQGAVDPVTQLACFVRRDLSVHRNAPPFTLWLGYGWAFMDRPGWIAALDRCASAETPWP
jgi:hypothetical protein